jgi:hypothetical protein
MTSQEWTVSTEPVAMLRLIDGTQEAFLGYVAPRQASERQLRLLACAIERAWRGPARPDPHTLATIQVAEAWADGLLTFDSPEVRRFQHTRNWWLFHDAGEGLRASLTQHDLAVEKPLWADLMREVIGNPFHNPGLCGRIWAPPDAGAPHHGCRDCNHLRTPTVTSIARQCYETRDYAGLPVLADALEEAGASGPLLEHLRTPGPHTRGCWALDLVSGKE